ncbi:Thiol:disulfide interchange protein TlpA [Anatilimnocola aggregata]|uniref:Thiol:disulfide interchange protein TlpA n=1 Tax=Anatilimnocola aggregata TaxID=2528021 RepID=A0A517YN05_9BACT|nr:TlpA disulfide reductase family protein [Anatilimnocola aggregata]QDU31594.1 Thiol:disulfide interchange protein TlpA [Anatilimnocola aggregata]
MVIRSSLLARFLSVAVSLGLFGAGLVMTGCNTDDAPVTAKNSKFKVSDDSGEKGGMPPATPPQGAVPEQPAAPITQPPLTPPGEGTPPVGQPPTTPPALPANGVAEDKDGSLTLSGEAAQLVEAINQLKSTEPPGNTQEEQLANLVKSQQIIVELSRRLLTLNKHPKLDQFALSEATQALVALAELRDPSAPTRMTLFAEELSKHPNAEMARTGRLMLFNTDMIAKLQANEKVDTAVVLKGIEDLLEKDGGDQQVFMVSTRVCQFLSERGESDAAAKGMRMIAASYQDNEMKELSDAAKSLLDSANVTELNVPSMLNDVYDKKEGAEDQLLAKLQGLFKDKNPNPIFIAPVLDVIMRFELLGKSALVEKMYAMLETAYSGHENDEVTKQLAEIITGGRKRYALVGQPFAADAVTVEGKKFDLADYKGKVLLVNLWGTFSPPSMEEMPVLRKLHEDLRAQGLEVIGLDLDVDLARIEAFFKYQKKMVPFPNYLSPEVVAGKKIEDWHATSLAQQFGLQSIPFYVLVNKEGNIDSIFHFRLDPERVGGRLKELLGLKEVPDFSIKPAVIENPTIPRAFPTPPLEAPPTTPEPPAETPAKPATPAKNEGGSWLRKLDRQLATAWSALANHSFLAEEAAEVKDAAATPPEPNAYLAKPDLTSTQLTDWLLRMLDKPKTIQARPGFTAAIVDACDRILADKGAKESEQLLAIENKLAILHTAACNDDAIADEQLKEFVAALKDDTRPRVARETAFYLQERKVLDAAALTPEECAKLLPELQAYYGKEKLAAKHLRMASGTVELINKLADGDAREKHFTEFGTLFAKSSSKELARYGKKLAQKPETKESDLVGKPLELVGNLADGTPFAWEKYRGKVVIVDFWATWCGPCRKEMPNVKALREKLKDKGFEVVGVSVDKDEEALATYLEENEIPWETLAGEEAGELATKYGVRGIPTMMLVDQQGNVVAVAHNIAALAPQAEKLLAK